MMGDDVIKAGSGVGEQLVIMRHENDGIAQVKPFKCGGTPILIN